MTVRAERRRATVIAVFVVALAAAGIGSVVTTAVAHRHRGVAHTSTSTASTVASSTTPDSGVGQVFRVGQTARLDDWTVVIDSYQIVGSFAGKSAAPGEKWLVARSTVANAVAHGRAFYREMVTARYATEVATSVYWREVPAESTVPVLNVGPHKVLTVTFTFAVPRTAQIFSVILRRALGTEKQTGDAVEFDLNCC